MNDTLSLLFNIALGAALMYLLDPDRGRSRRAFARDKMVRFLRKSARFIDQRSYDLENRIHGIVTERRLSRQVEQPGDEVIVERVRSKMGHKIAHPHSIEVTSIKGVVTLGGRAPETEIMSAISAARQVRGVSRVRDQIRAIPPEATLLRVAVPAPSSR